MISEDDIAKPAPERIYNWADSQLSIARFYGRIKLNDLVYVIATHEKGCPLVREDIWMRERKEADQIFLSEIKKKIGL